MLYLTLYFNKISKSRVHEVSVETTQISVSLKDRDIHRHPDESEGIVLSYPVTDTLHMDDMISRVTNLDAAEEYQNNPSFRKICTSPYITDSH